MNSVNSFLEKFDLETYLKRGLWFSSVIQEWIRLEEQKHQYYGFPAIEIANLWEELKYLTIISENWQTISDGHKQREQGMFYQAKNPLDFDGWLSTLDFFWTLPHFFIGETEEYVWSCCYCGKALYPSTKVAIFEHFHPISQFGGWETGNILPSCSSCNRKKVECIPTIWLWNLSCSKVRLWNSVRFLSWFRFFEHQDYLFFRFKLDNILKHGYKPFIERVSGPSIRKEGTEYFYNHWEVVSSQRSNIEHFEDEFFKLAIRAFEKKGHLCRLWQLASQEKTTKSILGLPVLESLEHTKDDYEQKSFGW